MVSLPRPAPVAALAARCLVSVGGAGRREAGDVHDGDATFPRGYRDGACAVDVHPRELLVANRADEAGEVDNDVGAGERGAQLFGSERRSHDRHAWRRRAARLGTHNGAYRVAARDELRGEIPPDESRGSRERHGSAHASAFW